MTGRLTLQRLRRYTFLALGLFTVFLITAQLEHHDIACHLKTPQHCTGCASSPVGANSHVPMSLGGIVLADAGGASSEPRLLRGTVLPARCSGRSPPASH